MKFFKIIFLGVGISYPLTLVFSNSEPFPEPVHPQETRNLLSELEPNQQEALQFIHNLGPYDPENYEGLKFNDFYVVAGNREIAEACLSLLGDERFLHYWQDTFHALGMMASVEPDRVDFHQLTEAVEQMEKSELPEEILMRILGAAYISVARFGNDRSEEFLAPRMTSAFWEERRNIEQNWALEHQEPRIYTPSELAVMNFNSLGEESGTERLKELVANEREEGDEALERAIGIVERNSPSRKSRHERNMALYLEWQEKHPESEEEADLPDDESGFRREDPEETEELDAPDESREPGSEKYPDTLRHPWLYGVVIAFVGVLGVILLWAVGKIRSG